MPPDNDEGAPGKRRPVTIPTKVIEASVDPPASAACVLACSASMCSTWRCPTVLPVAIADVVEHLAVPA